MDSCSCGLDLHPGANFFVNQPKGDLRELIFYCDRVEIFLAPGGPDHKNSGLHTMGKLGQLRFFMFSSLTK